MRKFYLLGAPLTAKEQAKDFESTVSLFGLAQATVFYSRTIDGITSKTIGLLQFDSILLAIFALGFQAGAPATALSIGFSTVLGACLVLATNLFSAWAGPSALASQDALIRVVHKVAISRALRFTIALWLSILGLILPAMLAVLLWLPK